MISILAVDLSLRTTGYATIITTPTGAEQRRHGLIKPPTRRDPDRMLHIATTVAHHARAADARLVAFEGISFSSKSSSTDRIGALHWFTRAAIERTGLPWIEVPPATIKMWACGRGNADKNTMVEAAQQRHGYRGRDDNVADAMHLHGLTMDALGLGYTPELPSPALRDKARQAVATVVPLLPPAGVLTTPSTPTKEHR